MLYLYLAYLQIIEDKKRKLSDSSREIIWKQA